MKRRIFFLAVAFLVIAFACKNEDDIVIGKCENSDFICGCGLWVSDSSRFIVDYVYSSGPFHGEVNERRCDTCSTLRMFVYADGRYLQHMRREIELEEISKELGDTAFNSKNICSEHCTADYVLYGNDVDSFSVFCDRPYDAQHPAMSSIDDIVSISFADPYAFVANGYSLPSAPQYSGVERDGETQVFVFYTDTLSNVSFCDHPHISYSFGLRLLSPPERTDTFTFTGRVVMSNGSVFEGEICRAVLEGKSDGVQ